MEEKEVSRVLHYAQSSQSVHEYLILYFIVSFMHFRFILEMIVSMFCVHFTLLFFHQSVAQSGACSSFSCKAREQSMSS